MRILLTLLLSAVFALPAFAGLGDTIPQTLSEIKPQFSQEPHWQGLAVYSTVTHSGIRIREYINAGGVIVAITWQGPFLPDLRQLLGVYFQTYLTGPASPATSLRHAELMTPDLVVQSYGHLRAFHGRAYLPGLLAPGVIPEQLQ
ncbi:hypothetical protein AAKU67_003055 [Oxalobacteraceae bacterium GrIS 2.11]